MKKIWLIPIGLCALILVFFQNFTSTSKAPTGNGHASSWDNRFTITTITDPLATDDVNTNAFWQICLFAPENTQAVAPASGNDEFKRKILDIEASYVGCMPLMSILSPTSTYGYVPKIASDGSYSFTNPTAKSVIFTMNHLAIAPADGNPVKNPFKSNLSGSPSSNGEFTTYDFFIYNLVPHSKGRYNSETQNLPEKTLGVMRWKVVLENSNSVNAKIRNIILVEDWKPLKENVNKGYLIGIEPSITADGRLLVWHNHLDQGNGGVVYSYNETPTNQNNWAPLKPITSLNSDPGTIDGKSLKSLYPLARSPIKSNLGAPYSPGEKIKAAYPWISWEGTDLFFTAANAPNGATRGGWAVVGESTGGQLRLIDGAFRNFADLYSGKTNSLVLITSGIGHSSSIWNPYKEMYGISTFPYYNEEPVGLFYHSNARSATEVSFKSFKDGRYLTYLNMNWALQKLNPDSTDDPNQQYDSSKTPDTSGNNFYGQLMNGAVIPFLTQAESDDQEFYGQMAQFRNLSYVDVSFESNKFNKKSFSVELMVKPLKNLANTSDDDDKFFNLLHIPGVMKLILQEDRQLKIILFSSSNFTGSGLGTALPLNTWSHVGATWNELTATLQIFINGERIFSKTLSSGFKINDSTGKIFIGPKESGLTAADSGSLIVAMDEIKISNIVRSPDEFADSAFIPQTSRNYPEFEVDSSITTKEFRVMDGSYSKEAAQLGSLLFRDNRLSSNGSVSCASCHIPSKGFTDGIALRTGLQGTKLSFNSPTLINRMMARNQTWDGKFRSPEEQAWLPLTNPNEMGMTVSKVLQFLNETADYKSRFNKVFGKDPDVMTVQLAIGAFVKSIISGKSKYDLAKANEAGVELTADELAGKQLFFGRARCAGCHTGSNFTDDQYHYTGIFNSGNFGLIDVTGRASDNRKVKTPTLRNLALTAPYFHNGSVNTLSQVIDKYITASNLNDPLKDSEMKPIALSTTEKNQLVAFLNTLNSDVNFAFDINMNETLPGLNVPPSAPIIGTATAGDKKATLTFTAPDSQGGGEISSYEVYANGSQTAIKTGPSSPLTVPGLTNGTAYTFKVRARNAFGLSPASAASNSVTPNAPTPPTAPTLGALEPGDKKVTVNFVKPTSDGGSAITSYEIFMNGSTTLIASGESSPITVTGLTNGTSYNFKVKARNSIGLGPASVASSSVTPRTVPTAPVIGKVTGGNQQVIVEFKKPSSDGGDAITRYEVYVNGSSTPAETGTSSPIIVTDLSNGTSYTFKVKARNDAGLSAASESSLSVTPMTVPKPPTITSVEAGNAKATLTFSQAQNSDGGSPITSYEIYANGSIDPIKTGATSPITVSGLDNGTSYTFKIRARNKVGPSSFSAASEAVVPSAISVPSINFSASSANLKHFQFMSPLTPSRTGSPITRCVSSPALPDGLILNQTTCALSGTPTAVSPQKTYRITASNSAGSSSPESLVLTVSAVNKLTFKAGELRLNSGEKVNATPFYLVYQPDGNLVIYTYDRNPLWSTKTVQPPSTDRKAQFQPDGNLVLYLTSNPYWSSKTTGQGFKLEIQANDPFLKILNEANQTIWTSSNSIMPQSSPIASDLDDSK